MKQFDVVVIGAGITGVALAWRLARTSLRVALFEKGGDVANGPSRANSGLMHSGIHEDPQGEVFRMCREGLAWYRQHSEPLGFELHNKPTVILATDKISLNKIISISNTHAATLNPEILSAEAARKRWPFLTDAISGALIVKDSAQISPYEACRAILENAVDNGLNFISDCNVTSARHTDESWLIESDCGTFKAGRVVITAGAGSNDLGTLFGLEPNRQKYLSGAYFMMAKSARPSVNEIFFGPAGPESKGVVMQQTVHGNLMLGPDSIDTELLKDDACNWQRLCRLWQDCEVCIKDLDRKDIIRTFSGERVCVGDGFLFENHLAGRGILRIDGIKSPGLTAAPAIAARAEKLLADNIEFRQKNDCVDRRLSINAAAETRPPREIVCRCEQIFAGQIQEAIERGAQSIESLRWQTRAGMGDCQGSFCRPTLITMLRRLRKLKTEEICLKNADSKMFAGDLK